MNAKPEKSRPHEWLISDKSFPLHPFLFALASVLALWAGNLREANFSHALPALACAFAFAGTLYLAVGILRRRLDARTAVIASIWIGGALFYEGLFGPVNTMLSGGFSMTRSLPVALSLLAGLTAIAIYMPAALINAANLVLNVIAIVLFATPAWQAVSYEWRHGAARAAYDSDRQAAAMPALETVGGTSRPDEHPPDIYHFVFDRYTSENTLREHYGHDDSQTSRFLEDHGFFVARDSHANYHRTAHSLASTFYMDYLDFLSEAREIPGDNWQPLHKMLGEHRVARALKARGYEFLQFGSWWSGTFHNPAADFNSPHGFSEFNMLYLRRTMLRPVFHALPDWPLTMRLDWDNAQCQRVAAQIEEIKGIGARDTPTYVFAHILVPHGPFNFATDGRCLSREEQLERGEKQGYVDQVVYAGRIIQDLVTHLQAQDRPAPVILVQSDEGPFPARTPGVPWHEQSEDVLNIKTAILNAYYFPGREYAQLTNDITPVNSYRVLFNTLFGMNLELLPNRVFVSPDDKRLYEFHDVTDRARRTTELSAEAP